VKAAIHQPNYLPWVGYFARIVDADVFVLLDDVQYTKNGYINRVRIKASDGPQWLTVPVQTAGMATASIREIEVARDARWREKHLQALRAAYGRAPHFGAAFDELAEAIQQGPASLAAFNESLIRVLCRLIGIETTLVRSSSLEVGSTERTGRLVSIVQAVGADTLVAGPSTMRYMEPAQFDAAGIAVQPARSDFAPYPQGWGAFEPGLSVVDALMNLGPATHEYLATGASPQGDGS